MKTKGKKKILIVLVTLSLILQLLGGFALAVPEGDEDITLENMVLLEDSDTDTSENNNDDVLDENSGDTPENYRSDTLANIDINTLENFDALEALGKLGAPGGLEALDGLVVLDGLKAPGSWENPSNWDAPDIWWDPDSWEAPDNWDAPDGLTALAGITALASLTTWDSTETTDYDSTGFLGTSIELRDGEIDITGNTADAIQSAIQTAIDEGATSFKVVGTKTNQVATITLDIPVYVTVKWGAETKDLSLVIDGGGTFEVVTGGSIEITGDEKTAIHSSSCKVSVTGGTVSASGEYSIAIHSDSGDVVVTAGTVSATGEEDDQIPQAIEAYGGSVLVTGGTVYASGFGSYAISQGVWNAVGSGGTVTVTGGLVKAETSSPWSDDGFAISLQRGGLAVFIAGTCVGDFEVWEIFEKGMVVEITTFDVPTSYAGTNNGITQKAGTAITSTNIVWDLSGTVPAIKFGSFVVYKPQGGPVEPPTPETYPVRLRETGDLFQTVNEAMQAAEAPAGTNLSTYTLEIIGDVTELAEIIIKKNVTLVAIDGSFTLTLPSNRHIKVESGGALTLGDGTATNILTIAPYIEVTNGSILVQDGVKIHDLKLNGPNVTGEIKGGRLEGITALDVKGGAKVTEISGGIFSATQDAVHVSDRGTIIELISGGSFYQTEREQKLHGHAVFVQNEGKIGRITGGYFQAERGSGLYVIRGAWVDEISGGTFKALREGLYQDTNQFDHWNYCVRVDNGFTSQGYAETGIGTISGGIFGDPVNETGHFGLILITDGITPKAKVGSITGGTFYGIVALQVDRGGWIGEISGGTFNGSQGMLTVGRIDRITGDVAFTGTSSYGIINWYTSSTTNGSIGEISGGTFTGSITGFYNAARIETISGGSFIGTGDAAPGFNNSSTATITLISGGSFTGKVTGNGFNNVGTIAEISGGTFVGAEDRGPWIVAATVGSGIRNTGTITLISNGSFIGENYGINNYYPSTPAGEGSIGTIQNGVFWGKTQEAIFLTKPLVLEPGLSASKGFGRYWGKDGAIFNDESLVTYPPYGASGERYFMSSKTEAVTGITATQFKYLAYGFEVTVIGSLAAVTGAGYYLQGERVDIDAGTWRGTTFEYWETDDGVVFDQATSPTTHFIMPDHNVTVTAIWETLPDFYLVTVIGSYATENGSGGYEQDDEVTIDAGYRPGYIFAGWQFSPEVEFSNVLDREGTFTMPGVDVVATAIWAKLPSFYLVAVVDSYSENPGFGAYLEDTTVTVRAGVRDGYTFTGWTFDDGIRLSSGVVLSGSIVPGAGIILDDPSSPETTFVMPGFNVTLTAHWAEVEPPPPPTYTVTYTPGLHGTFTAVNHTGLLAGAATPAAPNTPGEAGWRFTGWLPAVSATVTGNVTYVAQWEEIPVDPPAPTYTVTYLPGLHGTFAAVGFSGLLAGAATPAAPATPAEDGWRFTGWLPARAATVTGNVTYVAQWEEIPVEPPVVPPTPTYTVSYQPGLHGTFTAVSHTGLLAGVATPAAPNTPGEAGWSFTGWLPAVSATVTGNVTYVAQWARTEFTVTFVDHSGSVLKTEQVAPGASATAPPNPTREGYTFTGWDRGFTNVQADLTVRALYTLVVKPVDPNDYTPEEVLKILEEEGVPIFEIGGGKIPLYGTDGLPVWALVNLVLAVFGALLALVTVMRRYLGKKGEKKGSTETSETYSLEGMKNYNETEEKRKEHRFVAMLLTVVFALAGIVFFFFTENMKNLMVLVDFWTIANAVIFIAIIVCMAIALKKKDQAEKPARN